MHVAMFWFEKQSAQTYATKFQASVKAVFQDMVFDEIAFLVFV